MGSLLFMFLDKIIDEKSGSRASKFGDYTKFKANIASSAYMARLQVVQRRLGNKQEKQHQQVSFNVIDYKVNYIDNCNPYAEDLPKK